jgi:SAM-dependent methyltransferase
VHHPRGYYDKRLAAEQLERCYALAPARVVRYLEAEIDHVCSAIVPGERVLELGCGYGRVLARLAHRVELAVGIDTSRASLSLASRRLAHRPAVLLAEMDAGSLAFRSGSFDVVACVQNGIAVMRTDRRAVVAEAVRMLRPGGRALFSSYADRFWEHRLDWFRRQAGAGLVGELDEQRTGGGVIVCKDGFRATTVRPAEFLALARGLEVETTVAEVDGSSVFCEFRRD